MKEAGYLANDIFLLPPFLVGFGLLTPLVGLVVVVFFCGLGVLLRLVVALGNVFGLLVRNVTAGGAAVAAVEEKKG